MLATNTITTRFYQTKILLLCLFITFCQLSNASSTTTAPHIKVSLLSEHTQLSRGQTYWLGIHMQPDPDWHTYWQNPGDSGEAPNIEWQLPKGVSVGDISWPIPKAIPVAHLVNYGYENENVLLVPISIDDNYNSDTLDITANLSWLVCKEDCIPGWATLSLTLPIANVEKISQSNKAVFAKARNVLPKQTILEAKHEIIDDAFVIELDKLDTSQGNWHVFPLANDLLQHNAKQQILVTDTSVVISILLSDYFSAGKNKYQVLISNGETAFYVNSRNNQTQPNYTTDNSYSLVLILLMAFAGGVILNLMPCVLPVLAIKALSLQQKHMSTFSKLAYLLGVMLSFLIFASIIIVMQVAGQQIGWGFHMQSPWLIALLAFLFVFIALNLFGVIEFGSNIAGIGQGLINGETARSHFFTGVLAVVVASPCTAPFMAASLGVALVSPWYITYLIFIALAVGFALPVTLLFISPRFAKLLPKPGAWMLTFKHLLGFLMLGTVVWLLWIYANQTSSTMQALLSASILIFCLCLWSLIKVNPFMRILLYAVVLLSIAFPIIIQQQYTDKGNNNQQKNANKYSPTRLNELRNSNSVIFVNMTADWCITCKVNEQVALATAPVQSMLEQENIYYLVGDWTNKNQQILQYLNQYERAGVPLYVIYAGQKEGVVLPQILTPNIVTSALNRALMETQNVQK